MSASTGPSRGRALDQRPQARTRRAVATHAARRLLDEHRRQAGGRARLELGLARAVVGERVGDRAGVRGSASGCPSPRSPPGTTSASRLAAARLTVPRLSSAAVRLLRDPRAPLALDDDLLIEGDNARVLDLLPAARSTWPTSTRRSTPASDQRRGDHAYADAFADYEAFLIPRLARVRELLADHGTLYVHLD